MSCQCHDFKDRLLDLNNVLEMINLAYIEKRPLSLSRFGHAELLYLGWPEVSELTGGFEKIRKYNGGTANIDEIKIDVLEALKQVDITGILTTGDSDSTGWDIMTKEIFHKFNFTPQYVCSAWVTHSMVEEPEQQFLKWLNNKEIVLVGRRAQEAAKKFKDFGANVVDCLGIESYSEINEVHRKLVNNNKWEIALLAAGISATVLAPRVAASTGRIAIDFGHALDSIIDGHNFDHEKLVNDWNSQNRTS